ncbi:uncharacterized protein LOC135086281 isoform X1 [Ostrinia nubilalis]|uniref:uncharacterized protein LOC135086281 isoform X1 n=1 Tax=Ostrinia nubilalis TaxID=29057 RepID=UPI00308253D9
MELNELIAARGYVKGTITRLTSLVSTPQSVKNLSKENLMAKRKKLIDSFSQYEKLNIKILTIQPDDKEDVELFEENYYNIISVIDQELNSRDNRNHSAPMSKLHLPPIDVPIFSGKFSDYVPFKNLFHSLIDQNDSIDNVQKLYYLRSYLKNEPLDLVKNLPLTSESYSQAIKIIEDRYNNKHKLVNEHICLLLDLKPITKSTAVNLREFVSNVKQQISALSNLEPNVSFWDAIILCILYRKLDAYTSRAFQMERDATKKPTINTFLEYLDKRALALENADPGFHGQQRQPQKEQGNAVGRIVAYTAAQEPTCLYCAAAYRAAGAA